jgi:hypothetical protein
LLLDDDRFLAHRGHVRAAGRARAHDDGDLRDAARGELRLVVEDPPEVLAVREDFILHRQKRAARIDEIDARQAILERDLLRAQMLFHGQRVIRATFDGSVVGHDHAARTANDADAADEACSGQRGVVDVVGRELADLEPRRVGIEQLRDACAHGQLVPLAVFGPRAFAAAALDLRSKPAQLLDRGAIRGGVAAELVARRVDLGRERGHQCASAVAANSSRPINILRISLVPAPIS